MGVIVTQFIIGYSTASQSQLCVSVFQKSFFGSFNFNYPEFGGFGK
jgi:hypothetical protein